MQPSEVGQATSLQRLLMWSNTLSGTIPSTLQQLLGLRYLLLSDNQLSGTIPLHLGNLRALHWLTLHNNVLRYADSAGRRRDGVHHCATPVSPVCLCNC